MKQSTLIHDVTSEEITGFFQEVKEQLLELKKNYEPKQPTEYLTRNEVAALLKCDISSVHNWTKSGKLIPYGIANRVYYKRTEVEAALKAFGKNRGGSDL